MAARLVRGALVLAGVYARGRANALDVQLRRIRIRLRSLPSAMEGYRILHLSDLHLDGVSPLGDVLVGMVSELEPEMVALTGDYLAGGHPYDPRALAQLEVILGHIRSIDGIYAVAGNHDAANILGFLRDRGVTVLDDCSTTVVHGGHSYRIVGIRSMCDGRTPDMDMAFRDQAKGELTLVMAHKPDYAHLIAKRDVHLYLCGHTHAGQVHLPLIGPLLHNTTAPRERAAGVWRLNGMAGHTSPGLGTSFVDVRFGCRPEITLLTLTGRAVG